MRPVVVRVLEVDLGRDVRERRGLEARVEPPVVRSAAVVDRQPRPVELAVLLRGVHRRVALVRPPVDAAVGRPPQRLHLVAVVVEAVDVARLEVGVAVAVPGRVGVGVDDVERVRELRRVAGRAGELELAEAALVELLREPVAAAVLGAVDARVLNPAAADEGIEGGGEVRFEHVGHRRELLGVERVHRQRLLALGVAWFAGDGDDSRVAAPVQRARGDAS